MRKISVFLMIMFCFIFSGSTVCAQERFLNFKSGTEPDGFRGIKWETNIKTLKGLTYIRTDPSWGGQKIYSRKSDELRIGAAELNSIVYGFWRDRFTDVLIKASSLANCDALKDATFEKFGEGYKPNRFLKEYLWNGNVTGIRFEYNEISDKCSWYTFSKEINKQQEHYLKEKARKGAETGF